MNTPINDGGPAFPTVPVNHGYDPAMQGAGTGSGPGMTLRDWFAGRALTGLLASPSEANQPAATNNNIAARWSYDIADAMLKAREGQI